MLSLFYADVMAQPLQVPTECEHGPWLDVLRGTDEVAWALSSLIDWAQKSGLSLGQYMLVSVAGGCRGLDDEMREALFPFFARGFGDPDDPGSFKAFVRSGGTQEPDGKPMITQLPAYLARLYRVYALSTTPKTSRLHLRRGTAAVAMGKYDTGFDAGQHQLAIVDEGPGSASGWDGDVAPFLRSFQRCSQRLGMKALTVLANGGGVTVTEGIGALVHGIPLIVVEGTLRAADDIAAALRKGTFMDYASKHVETSGSFLTPEDVERLEAVQLNELTHIAKFGDPASLKDGVGRFRP